MALKQMEQAPSAIDLQKLSPAQRELTSNLARIQQDQHLGNEAKAQQSLDAAKAFVTKNPAEFTQQMAKNFSASLEAQVSYLESTRDKHSRAGVLSSVFGSAYMSQLGKDSQVMSDNAVKISDNYEKALGLLRDAATHAGVLARQSDEQLGGKKSAYVERVYTDLSSVVSLNLENKVAYTEMAGAIGRSDQRAWQECKNGAAVTAGIVITVVGMGAGGMLAEALAAKVGATATLASVGTGVGVSTAAGSLTAIGAEAAVAGGATATLASVGTGVGVSTAAGSLTAIGAEAAVVGISEGRLINLGEAGKAALIGAALGSISHIPLKELTELKHAARAAKAVATTEATAAGAAMTMASTTALAAEESVMAVRNVTSAVRAVEAVEMPAQMGAKTLKVAHNLAVSDVNERGSALED